ncbi:MAG: hypothetical protein PHQ74_07700 [Crocinitomicaceae bacterium]|nr:hypothetical protein [Crocinitomicaceae bacterium]
MKNWTIIIIVLTILFSCGKKTTMKGRIINPVTNTGIAGIKVVVTKPKKCLGYDGCGTKTIFETTSDNNGYFMIEKRFRKSKEYTIQYYFDDKKYLLVDAQVSPAGQEYNGTYFEFLLFPKGKYKRNFINIDCYDENDKLTVNRYYFKQDLYQNLSQATYLGCETVEGSIAEVPMGWYIVKGLITRNAISTPFADSIYVTEGGTHVWNIEY